MICYMPFIDIEAQLLDKLTATLGPVTIYCPGSGTVADHMLAAVREKRLDLRSGHGVNPDHLDRAVREFRAWADLHGGDIADLAGLFKAMQGRPPLIDETNPTCLGDQIRHFGEQNPQEAADPVFQAALFLSMAQIFDQQQVAVSRNLGEVQEMERMMLARLAGHAQDLEDGIGPAPDAGAAAGSADAGIFMTARRVQSWAELVCRDTGPRSFILYVTSSSAVLEHLLDRFESARGPLRFPLDAEGNGAGHGNRNLIEALESLATAKDLAAVSADCLQESGGRKLPDNLTLYALAGIPPLDFPRRLLAGRNSIKTGPAPAEGALNTLIGLMEK